MGPYQRTPKQNARAIRYPGLGVRSVGPVGDFLEKNNQLHLQGVPFICLCKYSIRNSSLEQEKHKHFKEKEKKELKKRNGFPPSFFLGVPHFSVVQVFWE